MPENHMSEVLVANPHSYQSKTQNCVRQKSTQSTVCIRFRFTHGQRSISMLHLCAIWIMFVFVCNTTMARVRQTYAIRLGKNINNLMSGMMCSLAPSWPAVANMKHVPHSASHMCAAQLHTTHASFIRDVRQYALDLCSCSQSPNAFAVTFIVVFTWDLACECYARV